MRNTDLLPCPCCGNFARIEHGKQYQMMLQDWHTKDEALYQPCSVVCRDCGLKITRSACNADCGSQQKAAQEAERLAVESWNRRSEPRGEEGE